MKLLAILAVIAGVLALGTAQLQVTPRIQPQNAERVWAETLVRPFGFETSVNSQTATDIVARGAEGVWQHPLSTPAQFNVQPPPRIALRGAEGIWHSPLSTPVEFNLQPSVRILVRNADSLWTSPLDKPDF
jgi:hypothetical protein